MANYIAGSVTWKLDLDDTKFKQQLASASAQVKSLSKVFDDAGKLGGRSFDSTARGASITDAAIGRVNSASSQTSSLLGRIRDTSDAALDRLATGANKAADSLGGLVKQGGAFIALGLGTALAAVTVTGFKFNNAVEQAETKILAFTKSAERTADILSFVKKEAAQTQFSFTDMADAAANLIPISKATGASLETLVRQAEVLAALNPAEGLVGAAFSLREALTGDFVSIVERFNLPRQRLNELKDQGVPALEAISTALREMGIDFDLVAKQGQTTSARLNQVKDSFTLLAGSVSQPFFDIVSQSLSKLQASPRWAETEKRLTSLSTAAAESVSEIIEAFEKGGISAALDKFGEEFSKLRIGERLNQAIDRVNFGELLNRLVFGLISAVQALPADQVAASLTGLFLRFISSIDYVSLTSNLVELLVSIIPDVISGIVQGFITVATENPMDLLELFLALGFLPAKILGVVGSLLGRIPLVGTFFKWIFDALTGVSQTILKPVRDMFGKIIQAVVSPFERLGGSLFNAGKNVIQGFLDGAGSLLSKVGQFFLDKLPGWIRDPFKKALGIKSPSKVFAEYGENITQGLVMGLNDTRPLIDRAMEGINMDVANPTFSPNVALDEPDTAQASSGTVVNQTNNIYNQVDLDRGLRDLAWQLGN